MRTITNKICLTRLMILVFFLIAASQLNKAQSMRELINDGVDLYKDKKFTDSEVNFKKGLEKSPESFAANFNLGDAYYKQQRYEDALGSFQTSLAQAGTNDQKAQVYHNIGNSLLKSDKIKESIEAYKKALKLNPDDADTKYNLSYALNLLKQQQNQQQNQNDKNKDKNKDKQDQQDKQNQQDQDKNKNNDDQKQDQNQQQKEQQKPDQNQQAQQDNLKQKEQKISKEEAERILQALKNNEKDLQKKLRKQKGTPVKTEKDW